MLGLKRRTPCQICGGREALAIKWEGEAQLSLVATFHKAIKESLKLIVNICVDELAKEETKVQQY
jgi:hypothetical protein